MSDNSRSGAKGPMAVELEEGRKYAFCTCGASRSQPFCDGSHQGTSMSPHRFTAEKSGTANLCVCKKTGKMPYCDGSHGKPER